MVSCSTASSRSNDADIARPAGDPRQTVDLRLVAELDRENPVAARALDGEPQADAGRDHHLLVERVELRGYAREDACGHVCSVRVAMKLLVRRFADARARRVGFADQCFESFCGERCRRIEGDLFEGAFHVGQLRLQPGQRLAEETQRLEEPHDIRPIPAGGRK